MTFTIELKPSPEALEVIRDLSANAGLLVRRPRGYSILRGLEKQREIRRWHGTRSQSAVINRSCCWRPANGCAPRGALRGLILSIRTRVAPPEMNDGGGIFGVSLRQQPNNAMAEQSLLGGLLANNAALDRVIEIVQPEHFYDPVHARLYDIIRDRVTMGLKADAVTMRSVLDGAGISTR